VRVTALGLLGGLALLALGAELLVRGASRIAAAFGVTPLVIGLTVVAFGTSTPELVVSVLAVREGGPEIAIGNVVGSNVFNVLFILGICALVRPLVVHAALVRRDVPLMIGVSLCFWLLALDGTLSRLECVLALSGLVGFVVFSVRAARAERAAAEAMHPAEAGDAPTRIPVQVGLVAAGLTLLVLGARWFVASAIDVAQALGVSETVIGLTIVAAGTSLPEVAASVIATLRGERDIAVGNVVGSNLFNMLGILGIAGLAGETQLTVAPSIVAFDLPVMVAVALACLPVFASAHVIARWEGALFLGYYVAYTAYLGLASTSHDALPQLSLVMMEFVVPLTVLTLAIVMWRSIRPLPADVDLRR
jgi:cation:H+ antiporter